MDMWEAIPKALDRFEQDPEVRVIVLKGRATRPSSPARMSRNTRSSARRRGIQYYEEIGGRAYRTPAELRQA